MRRDGMRFCEIGCRSREVQPTGGRIPGGAHGNCSAHIARAKDELTQIVRRVFATYLLCSLHLLTPRARLKARPDSHLCRSGYIRIKIFCLETPIHEDVTAFVSLDEEVV